MAVMLKFFADLILKLAGWRIAVTMPTAKKFVLIGAPHTSNWDFPLALLCFWSVQKPITWVAKKQLFTGPLKYFFSALGGIPVDRSAHSGFIQLIARAFDDSDEMILCLAPEGTRAKADYWKSGFYYIAQTAKVPVCFGYIDYAKRTMGFAETIFPSGDIDKDFEQIKKFYQDITGKYPEKQGPVRIKNHHQP
jgi:1-acyl-sn-glycerol-3-phosphate acyltransferase